MNKYVSYVFVLITLFFSECLIAQRKDSVRTDSSIVKGQKIPEKDKPITGYGSRKGEIFESVTIRLNGSTKKVFIQRLHKGSYSIYRLKSKGAEAGFYIRRNDIELADKIPHDKVERIEFLTSYLQGCNASIQLLPRLEFNHYGLIRFFEAHEACHKKPFARTRYALEVSTTLQTYSATEASSFLGSASFKSDLSITVGGSIELPIKNSGFSLSPGIEFQAYQSSTTFDLLNDSFDLVIDQTRLNGRLDLGYTFYNNSFSPFVKAGIIYSSSLSSKDRLYRFSSFDNEFFTTILDNHGISSSQLGWNIQVGGFYHYGESRSIKIQLGYRDLSFRSESNVSVSDLTSGNYGRLNVSEFQLLIGLLLK